MKINIEKIESAAKLNEGVIRKTPLLRSSILEKLIGSSYPIYLKAENLQHTGSFKVRGALNKIHSILGEAKKKGVVAASAGNHAQGVAYHAKRLGVRAKIVMPERTPIVKVRATMMWGAEVKLYGESYQEAYEEALRIQAEEGREFVHAFEDEAVICGQGTLGEEVLEQLPEMEVFVVPIGGGGLMSGCASYLKAKKPSVKTIAVQAAGCSTFLPSLEAGKLVTLPKVDTIAEGISAKRMGQMTFDICKELVDQAYLVTDKEISEALLIILENEHLFIEGSGATTVAAVLKNPQIVSGPTVLVLSGGNLDVNLLARIIEQGLVKTGRRVKFEATIPDVPGSLERLIHILSEQKASIFEIDHERVFNQSSLKEVSTYVQVETEGLDHVERLKEALQAAPWPVRFL